MIETQSTPEHEAFEMSTAAFDDTTKTTEIETETTPAPEAAPPAKKRRGFAAMDRAAVLAISRKGGLAAHERGTAHRFSGEKAREAGKKGGLAPHRSRGRQRAAAPSAPPGGDATS